MDDELLQKLKDWRRDMAQKESVASFHIFHNTTLETIASLKPKTKEELMSIKGIKERKFEKYGANILALINGSLKSDPIRNKAQILPIREGISNGAPVSMISNGVNESNVQNKERKDEKPYTISGYLNFLNTEFRRYKARVQGEVSSLDIRDNYLFFSLKDKDDKSILSCFMWKNNYELCGISLEIGMEIIVDGFPEIYPLTGRFNFRVSTIELVGEGALKKAYDKLRQKLEKEGLFSTERKKPIPEFPQRIGLITSETGAVIHDFLNNLGKHGYHIQFVNSRVEGQAAVHDLLSAINYFDPVRKGVSNGVDDKNIDVLVIIRGGGSMESLQAFNNEALVRKIARFNTPIICGIGHEKDVPLASLAADLMVSTPTAATVILNKSWERAFNEIQIFERDIIHKYQKVLADRKYQIEIFSSQLKRKSDFIFKKFESIKGRFDKNLATLDYVFKNAKKILEHSSALLLNNFKKNLDRLGDYLNTTEKRLSVINPMRQLKLGYSITSIGGKIVRSVKQVKRGEEIDIQIFDGKIQSQVNNIINE